MSYTTVFGNSTIFPSQLAQQAIALSADATYNWPTDANAGSNILAIYNDVTPSAGGFYITLPSALYATPGASVVFNNVGAYTFGVKAADGTSLLTVTAGTVWTLYLTSNSTAAGTWRSFQFGAGSSVVSATALAGAGLTVVAGQLAENFPYIEINTNYTTSVADQASLFLWTGGAGAFNFPAPNTLVHGWFVGIKNGGSGALTLTPSSGNVDGAATVVLNPNDSCWVFSDLTNLYTVGRGQSAVFAFSYISINVAGSGNYTLSTPQQNQIAYEFTGALTGNRSIIVPSTVQQYWVNNATTGAYTFQVKTAAGTGITLASGTRAILYSNGTNVVNASTAGIATPLAVVDGGTGTNVTFTAGSVVFAGAAGTYTQDNSNLFFDNTNNRLGIGTATPATTLDVVGDASVTGLLGVTGSAAVTVNLGVAGVASFANGALATPSIAHSGDLNTGMWFPAADTIAFSNGGNETMRLLPAISAVFGQTTAYQGARVDAKTANGNGIASWCASSTSGYNAYVARVDRTDCNLMLFYFGTSAVGSITTDTASTSFNTTSDVRLKRNVVRINPVEAITRLSALELVEWDWLAGGRGKGVIAQDAIEVDPSAVTKGDPHGVSHTDPEFRPWTVDYSKFVPDLLIVNQWLVNTVDELKLEIAALKAGR
ncbi:Intramolecular chaperone auto-processing domain containing protein [uncultured Caudovirales phage]|uniref:Intramolecular chaperone auto-processing domain containing protein n=1 Tax=uncultured Caudovirales phage TaxID=2100421 RepID=A0A6J5PWG0_9CAUD|nr:Intramolecular chaperone auto-processing domain containing protein [uncultured Caudovirales phage]CAB4176209.1 Intramolecular chaperone auto-processing domain containing protein [uncultured Caudovirales phage]CAB4189675.1 Intramolecular chaperone auto-processing domain containing protein [uncultured Caudovirales phage]